MKKNYWIVLAIGVALLAGAGAVAFLQTSALPTPSTSEVETFAVSLTIESITGNDVLLVHSGETALSLLERLNPDEPRLMLETKEYEGLGTLVEGMGGIRNGTDGKYWQYKVNDIMPQVGAGQFELHDGDRIRWYFAESEF